MALDVEQGKKMLQLVTSRYDDRHWRKKIEKTLSLPQSGVGDETQRRIFLYLKHGLKAYKSHRADPDSWIVGGFATQETIARAKFNPVLVDPSLTADDVAMLGVDPGSDVDETWWDDMLVAWFEEPLDETTSEESNTDQASTSREPDNNPAKA
ncbi:hypothetical protein [Nitrospira sp. Nam74]